MGGNLVFGWRFRKNFFENFWVKAYGWVANGGLWRSGFLLILFVGFCRGCCGELFWVKKC